jgi:hypothetical protein
VSKPRRSFVPRVECLETRLTPALPSAAPSLGPPPPPSSTVIWVSDVNGLQNAIANLQSGQTIVIQKGTYNLTSTLYIGPNSTNTSQTLKNVTIRGATDNFTDVVIRGAGGINDSTVSFGFYFREAQNITVADLSIGEVYFHPVFFDPSFAPTSIDIYHDKIYDGGEQLVKSPPGVNNCTVQYCLLTYDASVLPLADHGGGIDYTNGIDLHTSTGWDIADNEFLNLHMPDDTVNQYDPAVLIWNHSSNNIAERNTFINCDRAIAYGLNTVSSGHDNTGGVIRNNFIWMDPGLFDSSRMAGADGQIIAWDSPGTKIYQNTIITNGNNNNGFTSDAIQFRFSSTTAASGVEARNNLADANIDVRDGASYTASGNYLQATTNMFVSTTPGNPDLHLVNNSATQQHVIGQAAAVPGGAITDDFDAQSRPTSGNVDIGADQFGFSDNFNRADSTTLGSNWQIPPSFTSGAYHFQYRRHGTALVAGFEVSSNQAVSAGGSSQVTVDEVVGLSPLNPTVQADVTVNGSQGAGLFARAQSNGDAYVARLTAAAGGTAEILLYHGATNTFSVLGSKTGVGTTGTLKFTITGGATPILTLFLGAVQEVQVTGNTALTTAGGVGIIAWGPGAIFDNFLASGS